MLKQEIHSFSTQNICLLIFCYTFIDATNYVFPIKRKRNKQKSKNTHSLGEERWILTGERNWASSQQTPGLESRPTTQTHISQTVNQQTSAYGFTKRFDEKCRAVRYQLQSTSAGSSSMTPILELMNDVDCVLANLPPLNSLLVYRARTECTTLISCFAHLLQMFRTCQQM